MLDKGTFLQPLADKFVRLALQLLARYSSWLAAGLQQASQAPSDGLQQSEASELIGASQVHLSATCCKVSLGSLRSALEQVHAAAQLTAFIDQQNCSHDMGILSAGRGNISFTWALCTCQCYG